MKDNNVIRLTQTSILAAFAGILYIFVKMPLPIFPSFLELNFSMIPIILCGFMVGPLWGSLAVAMRTLVKIIFIGSSTAFVGESIDLVLGLSIVCITALIYKKMLKRNDGFVSSFKCGIIIVPIGIIVWTVMGIISNWLFAVPFYIDFFMGGDKLVFVNAISVVIDGVTVDNYMQKYLLYAVLPFNILLSSIVMGVTYIVYRPLECQFAKSKDASNCKIK